MYAIISPFCKSFDDIWLTYTIPKFLLEKLNIWQIVEIPFNNKIEIWIVLNISNNLNINFDSSKIKEIIKIKNETIFLKNYRVNLLKWIATHYITAIHNSSNLFLPKNLKEKIIKDKLKLNEKNSFKYEFNYNIELSKKQIISYNDIIKSKNNKVLLYWLTWSWKTEIYINLIKYNLDINKQSLLLIPEIILTNQISDKIKKIFWKEVLIINSTITNANKTKYWQDINNNNAKIIIWTRSAIFYPYNNLWLIIIDEEHDNSYISDVSPRYNTIKIAEKITEINSNKLILWSWTPSINSMYKWVKKEYELINLLEVFKKS